MSTSPMYKIIKEKNTMPFNTAEDATMAVQGFLHDLHEVPHVQQVEYVQDPIDGPRLAVTFDDGRTMGYKVSRIRNYDEQEELRAKIAATALEFFPLPEPTPVPGLTGPQLALWKPQLPTCEEDTDACNAEVARMDAAKEDLFTYKAWDEQQIQQGAQVVQQLKNAYAVVLVMVPPSPTRTRALNAIVDARMLANAAITHKGRF